MTPVHLLLYNLQVALDRTFCSRWDEPDELPGVEWYWERRAVRATVA